MEAMSERSEDNTAPKRSKGFLLVAVAPLAVFLLLVLVFGYQLLFGRDPALLPSALIGDPVPAVDLPALKTDKPGFGPQDFGGEPILVNVFASWCVPCRVEHPLITELSEVHGVPIYGLNSKDERAAALAWLDELGDPYARIGYDPNGRAGIDWGVYGYPETFLVSPAGEIVYKYVGPITPRILNDEFLPRIEALREGMS